MVRPKQRQLIAKPSSKNDFPSGFVNLSSKSDVNFPEEDGWVFVKKQKVNILIPPLPLAKQSDMADPHPNQVQTMPGKTGIEPSRIPTATFPVDDLKNSMPLACRNEIEVSRRTLPVRPISTAGKVAGVDPSKMASENCGRDATSKSHKRHGISSPQKTTKGPICLHGPISFLSGRVSLNQKLRASNLERKLQRAGGLRRWLASLGLAQFVRIFQGRSVDKFQLVNLNMKKLKDMGADAVGPRRKLMHALDCLCQPYCFEKIHPQIQQCFDSEVYPCQLSSLSGEMEKEKKRKTNG